MNIFAIGDLHLPGDVGKAMDVFGDHWTDHFGKITADWRARVRDGDVVLLAGDHSWAMTLDGARGDLDAVCALPGRKLFVRGNHDYWWGSISRVRAALSGEAYALQNDACVLGGVAFAGVRGWRCPGDAAFAGEDASIYERELLRLEMSLKDAVKKGGGAPIVCVMHFPPLGESERGTGFTRLMEQYGVRLCLFGHTHAVSYASVFSGALAGVQYRPVACDVLGFKLMDITELINTCSDKIV